MVRVNYDEDVYKMKSLVEKEEMEWENHYGGSFPRVLCPLVILELVPTLWACVQEEIP
jgi:hypothetical protein